MNTCREKQSGLYSSTRSWRLQDMVESLGELFLIASEELWYWPSWSRNLLEWCNKVYYSVCSKHVYSSTVNN